MIVRQLWLSGVPLREQRLEIGLFSSEDKIMHYLFFEKFSGNCVILSEFSVLSMNFCLAGHHRMYKQIDLTLQPVSARLPKTETQNQQ